MQDADLLYNQGFGGTNAHAILEEYIAGTGDALPTGAPSSNFVPFCVSAVSETSLLEQTRRLKTWLSENPDVNLSDLAWTLSSRRSEFPHRWSFSANSSQQLSAEMDKRLSASYEPVPTLMPEAKILGVFTGQGAQWATMAGALVRSSRFAEQIIDKLEASLAVLPDAPSWSLKADMLADSAHSRVSEAALSQPLCTAVQILLVEMLKSAGITFSAVVGHSSGEIAAAYAAGFLRAEDAIRIAYYRGVHTKLAAGRNGEKGSMLAAGASLVDAQELCGFEELEGRIVVAASNSSSSTTLSGDVDAIKEAQGVLEDEGKFARLLRVDKAYHSHHMNPCAAPYLESLRQCAIQVREGDPSCSWFSSVNEEQMSSSGTQLDGEYWKDNMTQCVLFSQAIRKAIDIKGPFDIALEVGPHPALQGPALQNIQDITGARIPYTGLLTRQVDDVESFAGALGYLWRHSVLQAESIESYSRTMSAGPTHRVLKGLPSYAFDHDTVYWRESRLSKAIRTRKTPYHELLGMACPDGTSSTHLRWKNLLNVKEIPWLSGHAVQGQVVFPAAGYMSMAIDACRLVAPHRQIRSLDLVDFVIGKAIIFDERSLGVETMLVLALDDELDDKRDSFEGTVRVFAGVAGPETTTLIPRSSCRVHVTFGEPASDLLPPRGNPISNFVDVDGDQFYEHLANVGYVYTGPFRGLTSLRRTLDAGTALITTPARADAVRSPMAHPATLDCTVQSVLLGFCYPGDGKLYALHVPTKIRRVSMNIPFLEQQLGQQSLLPVDSVVNETGVISGDAHLYAADGETTLLQMQGIEVAPLTPPRADADAQMFFGFEMGVATPDGELMMKGQRATEADYSFSVVCERIAYFYLKRLLQVLSPEDIENAEWHHKRLVDFGRKAIADLQAGLDPLVDTNWYNDTEEEIFGMMEKYARNP
jgi:hybrid polyketide synthase / nonribosomal peptide synthetase ACE1